MGGVPVMAWEEPKAPMERQGRLRNDLDDFDNLDDFDLDLDLDIDIDLDLDLEPILPSWIYACRPYNLDLEHVGLGALGLMRIGQVTRGRSLVGDSSPVDS